jgi:diguanylate cyclase (GGDEF)-like protein
MSTELPADPPVACADPPSPRPGRLAWLRDLGLRAIEPWIPEERIALGGESLRVARLVVTFTLVLLLLSAETWLFFHWAMPKGSLVVIDLAVAFGVAMTLFVPRALRVARSPELAANVVLAASFVVMTVILSAMGGILSPLLHWFALIPLLAVLMGARRSAWVWSGLCIATVCGFGWLEAVNGTQIIATLPPLAGSTLWTQRVVDVVSWIAMLLAIAMIYERHRDQRAVELASANSELTREVAQRRRAEQQSRYLAYHDELTELPNRQFFQEKLEQAMALSERDGRRVAVLFLDLDGFKEVNDTWGHRLGDALLKQVAERLRSCVRNADFVFRGAGDSDEDAPLVSRLGGDEFTVLLVKLRSEQEASIVARRILAALEGDFNVEGQQIHVSASIGIALYGGDVPDVTTLLKNADLAMYNAKQRGKNNYQFFKSAMNDEVLQRSTLARELRRARERGEFVVHYQPIVEARGHRVVAFEALLRWQHPVRGLLPPGEFIAVAEETGLIVPISAEVLRRTCQQAKRWQEAGLPEVKIAVNLSSVQLRHGGLAREVGRALSESGLDARHLELEITESAVMEDEDEAALTLTELKQLGVRIALDDFGTGYSSLSYLQRYPVDLLKIDRSFVRDVVLDPDALAITKAIIAMAHGLALEVVAEGVETEGQEQLLHSLGCDYLQGYRFSAARPAHEIPKMLASGVSPGPGDSGESGDAGTSGA